MPFNFEDGLDSLDAVPAEYQPAYAKSADGKFKIQDAYKPFVSAIIGTNTALGKTANDLKKSNKEAADRRALLAQIEDVAKGLGVEFDDTKPLTDALKAHIEELSTKAKNGGDIKINLDNIKKDYERKYGELDQNSKTTIGKMEKTLHRYLIGQQVAAALAKNKGSIELLQPVIEKSVKVLPEGDDYVVRVVDSEGNARSDGKGGWLGVEDFVVELKRNTAYARAFESEAKGGSGSEKTGANRRSAAEQTGANRPAKDGLSANEKIAAGLKKGQFERGNGRANQAA